MPPLEVTSVTGKVTAGGMVFIVSSIILALINKWGPWRKQVSDERAADFDRLREQIARQDLKIDRLEKQLADERDRYEAQRTSDHDRHDGERAIDRHRLNNITACFDALVLLLETNPERAPQALVKVKAMRAEQAKAEALEKGAMRAPKAAE